MKTFFVTMIVLFIAFPLFAQPTYAVDRSPPTFTCMDEFYTWAMMDMANETPRAIAQNNAIIDTFDSFESGFWMDALRENSLRFLVRIDDMFPTIPQEKMQAITVEVNPYSWDSYRIRLKNGVFIAIEYSYDHEISQYAGFLSEIDVDNMLVTVRLPAEGMIPAVLVENHDSAESANRLYNQLFADETFRPLTDLVSDDDTIREAAENVLRYNIRENIVFFDETSNEWKRLLLYGGGALIILTGVFVWYRWKRKKTIAIQKN